MASPEVALTSAITYRMTEETKYTLELVSDLIRIPQQEIIDDAVTESLEKYTKNPLFQQRLRERIHRDEVMLEKGSHKT